MIYFSLDKGVKGTHISGYMYLFEGPLLKLVHFTVKNTKNNKHSKV